MATASWEFSLPFLDFFILFEALEFVAIFMALLCLVLCSGLMKKPWIGLDFSVEI
jgi:ABC-type polysaccharide transport system permease subunit